MELFDFGKAVGMLSTGMPIHKQVYVFALCELLQMAIGMLWYGPLFGKQFLQLQFGTDKPTFKKDPGSSMAWVWLTSAMKTLGSQAVFFMCGCADLMSTVVLGLLLSGIVAAQEFEKFLFSNEEMGLALLRGGHCFVATMAVLSCTLYLS